MSPREDRLRMEHMLEHAEEALQFVENM